MREQVRSPPAVFSYFSFMPILPVTVAHMRHLASFPRGSPFPFPLVFSGPLWFQIIFLEISVAFIVPQCFSSSPWMRDPLQIPLGSPFTSPQPHIPPANVGNPAVSVPGLIRAPNLHANHRTRPTTQVSLSFGGVFFFIVTDPSCSTLPPTISKFFQLYTFKFDPIRPPPFLVREPLYLAHSS